jgi:hypothetical protein
VIISDRLRYVFIEQPHTASTAVREELCELYGGSPILHRHATWPEFLAVATAAQKKYFVFSGLRNPLDEAISVFFKYKTDHKGRFTRTGSNPRAPSQRRQEAFEFVNDGSGDFAAYLARYHRLPFDNDTLIHHRRMGFVIRYEHLQEDFARVLEKLGIEQVRPLPVINRTDRKQHYLTYYTPEAQERARHAFGPFMKKWGYPLPPEWGPAGVPRSAELKFRALGIGRFVYRRYIRTESTLPARLVSGAYGAIRPLAHRLLRM